MIDLHNRLAVVSGGARDIGRAIVLRLAECGASVAFCYRHSAQQASETVEAAKKHGVEALALAADVTRREEIDAFVSAVRNAFSAKPIDILVNNSGGIFARKTMTDMDEDFWDRVIDLNVKSTFLLTKAVLPHMSDGSAIVNMS